MHRLFAFVLLLALTAVMAPGAQVTVNPPPPSATNLSGIVPAVNGGTGVANNGTLTVGANTSITGGGTLALAGYTLTVPASDTVAELGQANTFTGANTFDQGLQLTCGTLTASAPAVNITQTWNNSGVVFTGWQETITNTASSASSNLINILVGSTSELNLSPAGQLTVHGAIVTSNSINGGSVVTSGAMVGVPTTCTSGTTALSANTYAVILDGTSNSVTVTLPSANVWGSGKAQFLHINCKNATNTVTVNCAGSDHAYTPAGSNITTFTMSTNTGVILFSDGSSIWYGH